MRKKGGKVGETTNSKKKKKGFHRSGSSTGGGNDSNDDSNNNNNNNNQTKGASIGAAAATLFSRRSKDKKKYPGSRKYQSQPSSASTTSVSDQQLVALIESDKNRSIVELTSDGNCLFRAISDQLYHDYGAKHDEIRADICDYLEAHQSQFELFVVTDDEDTDVDEGARTYQDYLTRMRDDGTWGGNLELVAAATLYTRRITLFTADLNALNFDPIPDDGAGEKCPLSGPNMLISYHDNEHYNSVRDSSVKFIPLGEKTRTTKKKKKEENKDSVVANGTHSMQVGDKIDDDGENEVEVELGVTEDVRDSLGGNDDREGEPETDTTREPVERTSSSSMTTDHAKPPPPAPLPRKSACPCGSGLKYKQCCSTKDKAAARQQSQAQVVGPPQTATSNGVGNRSNEEPPVDGKFRMLTI